MAHPSVNVTTTIFIYLDHKSVSDISRDVMVSYLMCTKVIVFVIHDTLYQPNRGVLPWLQNYICTCLLLIVFKVL